MSSWRLCLCSPALLPLLRCPRAPRAQVCGSPLARSLHVCLGIMRSTMLWRHLLTFCGRRRSSSGGSSSRFFSALSLGFAHDFYVSPDFVESRCDLGSASCNTLIHDFSGLVEAFVEVKLGYLCSKSALDILDSQATSARMSGLDNVEEVKIGEPLPEFVVLSLLPRVSECG
jgi:hypothetical protein